MTMKGQPKPQPRVEAGPRRQVRRARTSKRCWPPLHHYKRSFPKLSRTFATKLLKKIAVVSTTLRTEIAALRTESDAAFAIVNNRLDSQNEMLGSLEKSANATSDSVTDLEAKVKQLHNQVEQLSEKCLDLEGQSKCQNLRIAGVKEGEERGQGARDFVAQLLMEVLQLDEKPMIDRAHRALRQ